MQMQTEFIANCILQRKPVCFAKLGDGEMAAIVYGGGGGGVDGGQCNCDGTFYSAELRFALLDAVNSVLIPAAVSSSSYVLLGGWHSQTTRDFWLQTFICDVSKNNNTTAIDSIPWVHYHTLLFDNDDFLGAGGSTLQNKLSLYRSIRETPSAEINKIVICNQYVAPRMQLILNANYVIHIPLHNWFCDGIYEQVKNGLFDILSRREHQESAAAARAAANIVVIAGGIVSKVLIADCLRHFPNEIYLDIGSALDLLCTKRDSRGWQYSYEDIESAARDSKLLLPDDEKQWNDPRLQELVFEPAQTHLGIHLPR